MGPSRAARPRQFTGVGSVAVALLLSAACGTQEQPPPAPPVRPADTLLLHHVGLNSTDPDAAIEWYLQLWPQAERTEIAGKPALSEDMHLIFTQVASPPPGAFDPALGRPRDQSPIWHIGAYANTTDMDASLAAIGVEHLPLYTGVEAPPTVWRSGLTPYAGTRTAEALADAEPAEPRGGGFSYILAPDGVLFEVTGGPNTTPSLSHVHLFHEQPMCAANWYADYLGMSLGTVPAEDGSRVEREPYDPCEGEAAAPGWPSLEPLGTIRQPRASVSHGNGSLSAYPRQCVGDRCGGPQPLVSSRGQGIDHVGFTVRDVEVWFDWLTARGVTVLEEPHEFGDTRAFMFEGPDGIAIELVER